MIRQIEGTRGTMIFLAGFAIQVIFPPKKEELDLLSSF